MGTFTIEETRKRGQKEIARMAAKFLKDTGNHVSISDIAMAIGFTPEVVKNAINSVKRNKRDASTKKQAVLNNKGRQTVKGIANSFGLRINKLSNDDILTFQITRRNQDPKKFLNALNRSGIQYKTLKYEGPKGSFMVQLWPKGERPNGKQQTEKTTGSDLDGSTYIRRAQKRIAKLLNLLAGPSKTMPASQLSFELADSLAQDKGFLKALETLKTMLEKRKDVDKEELMGWVVGRMSQLDKQIKLLDRQLNKTTQTFMAPKEEE